MELEYKVPEHFEEDGFRWEYKVLSVFTDLNDARCKEVTKLINEGGWEPYMVEAYGGQHPKATQPFKPACMLILRRKVVYTEDCPNFGPSD